MNISLIYYFCISILGDRDLISYISIRGDTWGRIFKKKKTLHYNGINLRIYTVILNPICHLQSPGNKKNTSSQSSLLISALALNFSPFSYFSELGRKPKVLFSCFPGVSFSSLFPLPFFFFFNLYP